MWNASAPRGCDSAVLAGHPTTASYWLACTRDCCSAGWPRCCVAGYSCALAEFGVIKAGKCDIEGLTRLFDFTVRPLGLREDRFLQIARSHYLLYLICFGRVLKDIQEETS